VVQYKALALYEHTVPGPDVAERKGQNKEQGEQADAKYAELTF